jgi:hypothetical protein
MGALMQDVRLTLGTKENLIIDVNDEIASISTLNGLNVTYDWREKGATSWVGQNLPATNAGMRAFCLIDTSGWTTAKIGRYEVYLRFNNLPEVPRLGPFEFRVDE